jgi:hypothetical protein
MLLADFAFVVGYGPRVPRWDDYKLVPALTGDQRLTWGWLWEPCNEHRIALPKLILVAAYRLSNFDFRAGMYLTVGALGALALGLVATAGRLRGATCYRDAFFPLLLLHLGHHSNLLWSIQFAFVLSTVLACAVLLVIAWAGPRPSLGSAALAAALLALLPLCTANGLAYVPALALWLCGLAAFGPASASPRDWSRALLAPALAAPALTLTALYFVDYPGAAHHSPSAGAAASATTALQFLSLGFGPAGVTLWPVSGVAVIALLLVGVAVLLRAVVDRPEERPRALGLLAFLAAVASLAAGIGWGRSGMGELAGFQDRYVTMAVPALCLVYLACELYGTPFIRHFVPTCLFVAMCLVLWPNTRDGVAHGREVSAQALDFEKEVRDGVPTYVLVRRYTPYLHPSQDALTELLGMLQRAGIGVFRSLRGNPSFRELAVPLTPSDVRLLKWERGTAHVTGVDPQLVFTLPESRYVCGIRLTYTHASPRGTPAHFQLTWKRLDQADFPPTQRYANWALPTGPAEQTTTVWVCDEVKQFRIQPDNQPCDFHISKLVLLVP